MSKRSGKRLFVNCCIHKAINLPKNQRGVEISDLSRDTRDLEIPLVVGSVT